MKEELIKLMISSEKTRGQDEMAELKKELTTHFVFFRIKFSVMTHSRKKVRHPCRGSTICSLKVLDLP